MTSFELLTAALDREQVEYVIVGGVAATAHGSPRFTQDLDIVYSRSPENIDRLVRALAPLSPYPRGAPPGLPFYWDAKAIRNGLNFTLITSAGWIDLLGEIAGGGTFESLEPNSIEMEIFGRKCRVLALPALIESKLAAGRPKDMESLAELRQILAQSPARK